jgi:general secretion pathway protein H
VTPARPSAGFTLIELLMVLLLVAMTTGLIGLSLRDDDGVRLEREAQRLSALIEAARAQARASGLVVHFEFTGEAARDDAGADSLAFRFVGLPDGALPPGRWLQSGTRGQILGARSLLLGPEPLIGRQRIQLSHGEAHLILITDGLGPFIAAHDEAEAAALAAGQGLIGPPPQR